MADEIQRRTSGDPLTPKQYTPSLALELLELPHSALSRWPVVVTQPCLWATEETVTCYLCSVISGVDKGGPGPDFSPTFTDLLAFHYFPMTPTNTTFNLLIKLQLINNNKVL